MNPQPPVPQRKPSVGYYNYPPSNYTTHPVSQNSHPNQPPQHHQRPTNANSPGYNYPYGARTMAPNVSYNAYYKNASAPTGQNAIPPQQQNKSNPTNSGPGAAMLNNAAGTGIESSNDKKKFSIKNPTAMEREAEYKSQYMPPQYGNPYGAQPGQQHAYAYPPSQSNYQSHMARVQQHQYPPQYQQYGQIPSQGYAYFRPSTQPVQIPMKYSGSQGQQVSTYGHQYMGKSPYGMVSKANTRTNPQITTAEQRDLLPIEKSEINMDPSIANGTTNTVKTASGRTRTTTAGRGKGPNGTSKLAQRYKTKQFHCDYDGCNYSCHQSCDLKKHKRVHTGERPFKCTFDGCDSAFTQSSHLERHYQRHRAHPNRLRCNFDFCLASFASATALMNHQKRHLTDKPYLCENAKCDKAYATKQELMDHKQEHLREKQKQQQAKAAAAAAALRKNTTNESISDNQPTDLKVENVTETTSNKTPTVSKQDVPQNGESSTSSLCSAASSGMDETQNLNRKRKLNNVYDESSTTSMSTSLQNSVADASFTSNCSSGPTSVMKSLNEINLNNNQMPPPPQSSSGNPPLQYPQPMNINNTFNTGNVHVPGVMPTSNPLPPENNDTTEYVEVPNKKHRINPTPYNCSFRECTFKFATYGEMKQHEKLHLKGDLKFVQNVQMTINRGHAEINKATRTRSASISSTTSNTSTSVAGDMTVSSSADNNGNKFNQPEIKQEKDSLSVEDNSDVKLEKTDLSDIKGEEKPNVNVSTSGESHLNETGGGGKKNVVNETNTTQNETDGTFLMTKEDSLDDEIGTEEEPSENCDQTVTQSFQLSNPNKKNAGDKPFKCDFKGCTYASSRSDDLVKHKRKHTGERPYKCPFEGCRDAFKQNIHLVAHIRLHTGERPYICDVEGCDAAFITSGRLDVHKKRHTAEKPFLCTIDNCKSAFAALGDLKLHKEKYHALIIMDRDRKLPGPTNLPFPCNTAHHLPTQLQSSYNNPVNVGSPNLSGINGLPYPSTMPLSAGRDIPHQNPSYSTSTVNPYSPNISLYPHRPQGMIQGNPANAQNPYLNGASQGIMQSNITSNVYSKKPISSVSAIDPPTRNLQNKVVQSTKTNTLSNNPESINVSAATADHPNTSMRNEGTIVNNGGSKILQPMKESAASNSGV